MQSLPNVRFLSGATDVHPIVDGETIAGIEVEDGSGTHSIAADLSVGCAGRDSAGTRWLLELGFEPPPVSAIRVDMAGSIRFYRRAPEVLTGAEMLLIYPKPPDGCKFAALLPVEGDRWICTLCGGTGSHAPSDEEGFLEFAKNLPVPDVYNVISQAEPLSSPAPFAFLGYLRRHFEKLSGSRSVIWCLEKRSRAESDVLYEHYIRRDPGGGPCAIAAKRELIKLLRNVTSRPAGKAIDAPWKISVSEDISIPGVHAHSTPGQSVFNGYLGLVRRAAARDARVYDDFMDVMHLQSPPAALFQPSTLTRVVRANITI